MQYIYIELTMRLADYQGRHCYTVAELWHRAIEIISISGVTEHHSSIFPTFISLLQQSYRSRDLCHHGCFIVRASVLKLHQHYSCNQGSIHEAQTSTRYRMYLVHQWDKQYKNRAAITQLDFFTLSTRKIKLSLNAVISSISTDPNISCFLFL